MLISCILKRFGNQLADTLGLCEFLKQQELQRGQNICAKAEGALVQKRKKSMSSESRFQYNTKKVNTCDVKGILHLPNDHLLISCDTESVKKTLSRMLP